MDINHEASVRDVLHTITSQGTLDPVIVATGILHHDDGLQPEKSLSMLDPENLAAISPEFYAGLVEHGIAIGGVHD